MKVSLSKISAVTLAAMALIAGTASHAQQGSPLLTSMQKAGEVKIAVPATAPWISISPNGETVGYLYDVTALALKAMGAPKITSIATTFDAMIPGLQAQRFDMLPGALLITEARCKTVLFSDPISAQQDALYVLPGNPKKLTGYSQLAQTPTAKVALLTGSAQEALALQSGIKSDQIVRVPDVQAGISTVVGGRADTFIVGQFSVPNFNKRGVDAVVDKQSPVRGVGIAFRKEDVQFRDQFNAQLTTLRTNGTMKQLYTQKYSMPNWDVLEKTTKPSQLAPGCD